MKRYSLANYILSIEPADPTIKSMFGTISIGGQGSYLGSIRLSVKTDLWTTKGFATGAWVHDKSLDRTGTCTVNLHQLSDEVIKFIKLCNIYYGGDYNGCTLSVSDTNGNKVASCEDCYIQKPADQEFADTSADQDWIFTCGKVSFQ